MTDILNTKLHSDIKQNGFIYSFLPDRYRPYFLLARLDRPIGVWLLLIPSLWGIVLASGGVSGMGIREWYLALLFGIGAVVMRGAGCVINDIWDRDLDAQVGRTAMRPLASGALSVRHAVLFLLGLLGIGFAILMQMNVMTIILGFVAVPLIVFYPLMKRVTWWPQAFLGLVFNFGILMGYSAVSGSVGGSALLLYLGGLFWTLGYDTVYAHQDKEDDALVGVKSTALKFGAYSKRWVSGFYGVGFLCLILAAMVAGAHMSVYVLSVCVLTYGIYCLIHWRPDDQVNSLEAFKSSRNLGLLVLLALAAG